MINERRAILSLVAMGRITAAEAERLILIWQDGIWQDTIWQDAREWIWIAIVCAAACVMQAHPHFHFNGLGTALHTVVDQGTKALHTAASIGFKKMGGSV